MKDKLDAVRIPCAYSSILHTRREHENERHLNTVYLQCVELDWEYEKEDVRQQQVNQFRE